MSESALYATAIGLWYAVAIGFIGWLLMQPNRKEKRDERKSTRVQAQTGLAGEAGQERGGYDGED